MIADSKLSVLEGGPQDLRPDASAPSAPAEDSQPAVAATPEAEPARAKPVLVASTGSETPAAAAGDTGEPAVPDQPAKAVAKADRDHHIAANGIGVMRAAYDGDRDYLEVRGGVPTGLRIVAVQVETEKGVVIGRTQCKPPSKGCPASYPAFMHDADWFTFRKGGAFQSRVTRARPIVLRFLDQADGEIARMDVPLKQTTVAPKARKGEYHVSIDQFFFERHWNVMSIRGGFYSAKRAKSVEIWADNTKIGDAQIGLHRPLSKLTANPANGFALETSIPQNLFEYERIYLKCTDHAGKVYQMTLPAAHLATSEDGNTLFYNKKWNVLAAKNNQRRSIWQRMRDALIELHKRFDLAGAVSPVFALRQQENSECVVLFVNNVNPGGRPEKWDYFIRLYQELESKGLKLVIAQQGGAASPEDPPMPFIRMTDVRTWLKGGRKRMLRATGRTSQQYMTMLHEAAMLDFGYEENKPNRDPTWVDSYWRASKMARVADEILNKYKPKACLIWHEWNQASHVCKWLCDAYGIPTTFCHDGALPMTMGMDSVGEMAESTPVVQASTYYSLPLEKVDRKRALLYSKLVTETGMNRKSTVADGSLGMLLDSVRAQGKKVLFYAGCNDWQTGMLPVWWDKSTIHSPIFIDTYDAFRYLRDLCERRGWVLLFKPHPHLEPKRLDLSSPNVIFVREANIHECVRQSDVCLTLVSATAYMSMFNDRPTVLLGRNSLSLSGCCYEPDQLGAIPLAIEAALKREGYADMKRKWVDHLARMIRYTLHPMHPDSEKLMGKTYADTARFIAKQAKFSPVLHNAR